ncbi:MAG TPA: hypothetical protein GXZ36_03965 [Firmicutes bacterium]|nr:hypothetical protein [Bacillota bacterium]
MKKNEVSVLGWILVILGGLLLIGNLGLIRIDPVNLWPLFPLGLGLLFELRFFTGGREDPNLLVPGGILVTISITFLIFVTLGWHWMGKLWPLFVLAPAVGLAQKYLFGERERGLLIPVGILSIVGLTFLANNLGYHRIWRNLIPLAMILIGGSLLFRRRE